MFEDLVSDVGAVTEDDEVDKEDNDDDADDEADDEDGAEEDRASRLSSRAFSYSSWMTPGMWPHVPIRV